MFKAIWDWFAPAREFIGLYDPTYVRGLESEVKKLRGAAGAGQMSTEAFVGELELYRAMRAGAKSPDITLAQAADLVGLLPKRFFALITPQERAACGIAKTSLANAAIAMEAVKQINNGQFTEAQITILAAIYDAGRADAAKELRTRLEGIEKRLYECKSIADLRATASNTPLFGMDFIDAVLPLVLADHERITGYYKQAHDDAAKANGIIRATETIIRMHNAGTDIVGQLDAALKTERAVAAKLGGDPDAPREHFLQQVVRLILNRLALAEAENDAMRVKISNMNAAAQKANAPCDYCRYHVDQAVKYFHAARNMRNALRAAIRQIYAFHGPALWTEFYTEDRGHMAAIRRIYPEPPAFLQNKPKPKAKAKRKARGK